MVHLEDQDNTDFTKTLMHLLGCRAGGKLKVNEVFSIPDKCPWVLKTYM